MVILLVDDEPKVANFVKQALEREKYTVETAATGEEAIRKTSVNDYDLVILDIMLPGKSGYDVIRHIRELKLDVPVLMLTAKNRSVDKAEGLNQGADDYLAKPFDLRELLARVHALSRRIKNLTPNTITVGDLILDTISHEVTKNDKSVKLTGKEFRILEMLMRNPGLVLSRTLINERVWGYNYVKSNIIDVYMNRLRNKIDGKNKDPMIITIHGTGYKIKNR